LNYDNILTQGSFILNTDWVIGIAISNDDEDIINLWNCLF